MRFLFLLFFPVLAAAVPTVFQGSPTPQALAVGPGTIASISVSGGQDSDFCLIYDSASPTETTLFMPNPLAQISPSRGASNLVFSDGAVIICSNFISVNMEGK